MGVIKAPGSSFYYEERCDGPPILLIPRPDLPPPRGGPWSVIWPEPAGSSPTTGAGIPGRGRGCPLGRRACARCRRGPGRIGSQAGGGGRTSAGATIALDLAVR